MNAHKIERATSDTIPVICFRHYLLLWLSIITSPRGTQMDTWLSIMCIMDFMPMIYALVNTWYLGLLKTPQQQQQQQQATIITGEILSLDAVLNIVSILRNWSPAYQFNELVLNFSSGNFVNHTYCLMVFTVLVTQSHKLVMDNFYRVEVKL